VGDLRGDSRSRPPGCRTGNRNGPDQNRLEVA
jgi:hypothetical protein